MISLNEIIIGGYSIPSFNGKSQKLLELMFCSSNAVTSVLNLQLVSCLYQCTSVTRFSALAGSPLWWITQNPSQASKPNRQNMVDQNQPDRHAREICHFENFKNINKSAIFSVFLMGNQTQRVQCTKFFIVNSTVCYNCIVSINSFIRGYACINGLYEIFIVVLKYREKNRLSGGGLKIT